MQVPVARSHKAGIFSRFVVYQDDKENIFIGGNCHSGHVRAELSVSKLYRGFRKMQSTRSLNKGNLAICEFFGAE